MDYVWSFLPPPIRHQWCPEDNYAKLSILFPMDSDTIDINLMKSDNCSAFSLLEIPIDSDVSYLIRDQSHMWLVLFHTDMMRKLVQIRTQSQLKKFIEFFYIDRLFFDLQMSVQYIQRFYCFATTSQFQ